jgi:hypothetical protein
MYLTDHRFLIIQTGVVKKLLTFITNWCCQKHRRNASSSCYATSPAHFVLCGLVIHISPNNSTLSADYDELPLYTQINYSICVSRRAPQIFISCVHVLMQETDFTLCKAGWYSDCAGQGFVCTVSRSAVGPGQPPVQWVLGTLSPGVKQTRHVAGHSPTLLSTSSCHSVQLMKQRDSFFPPPSAYLCPPPPPEIAERKDHELIGTYHSLNSVSCV